MDGQMVDELRRPFPAEVVGKLPRVTCMDCRKGACRQHPRRRCDECGQTIGQHIHLDFVSHAHVTDRLLSVDPTWTWEPMVVDPEAGGPRIVERDGELELWGWLTVGGVRRPAVGVVAKRPDGSWPPDAAKQLVSDLIRNGAMRFGVALSLWAREDLESVEPHTGDDHPPEHDDTQVDEDRQRAVVEAKRRVLAAAGGDREVARRVWQAAALDDPDLSPSQLLDAAELLAEQIRAGDMEVT